MAIKVIGLDIAKSVLLVHGVDEAGQAVLRRKLRRCDVLKLLQASNRLSLGLRLVTRATTPGDAEALARSILRLASDADLRAQIAAAGEEDVRRHWPWPQIIARMRDVYEEVARP